MVTARSTIVTARSTIKTSARDPLYHRPRTSSPIVLPNNDVIVAEQKTGHLTLLRDQDGNGKAYYIERYADEFKAPYGLAYQDGFVLVADQEGIWRVPHVSGATPCRSRGSAEDH